MKKFLPIILSLIISCGAAYAQDPFITTWVTDDGSIVFRDVASGYYDVTYYPESDPGASQTLTNERMVTGLTGLTNGVAYTVEISGDFSGMVSTISPSVPEGTEGKLRSIDQWGDISWTTMANAFRGYTTLSVTATDAPDLSGVTSMMGMFQSSGLTSANFNHWDVSTITDMSWAFAYCPNFNGDVSEWDVSNVTDMSYMFRSLSYYEDHFSGDLSGWDVGNVASMSNMLSYTAVSQENLDAMLLAWSQLPSLQSNVSLSLEGLIYCDYVGREALINDYNWTITGATSKCQQVLSFDPLDDITYGEVSLIVLEFENTSNLPPTSVTSSDTDVATIVESPQYTYKVVIQGPGTTTISAQTDESTSYFASNVATQELVVNEQPAFITKWQITNTGSSGWDELQLTPSTSSGGYTVDWGDGDKYTGTYAPIHTYASEGEYTVKITGDYPYFLLRSSDRSKLIEISQWGSIVWEEFWGSFQYCTNLTYTATDAPDLSNVTRLQDMFSGASSFDADLGSWDISTITNMYGMLNGTALSASNYDETLAGWAENASVPGSVILGASGLNYCNGGDARTDLINNHNWTITDAGQLCPPVVWDGSQWDNTVGPTASDNVEINGDYSEAVGFECANLTVDYGVPLTMNGTLKVNGNLTNFGSIVIESGATLITFDGNTISNNITFKRNTRYADGKYSFIGSPVEFGTTTGENLGTNVYKYDESAHPNPESLSRWVDAFYLQLVPGMGYTQANQQLITFTGRPNDGNVTRGVGYVNDGWHLVSNPYPAAIDIDAFIDGNGYITGDVYIWDDNNSESGRGSSSDYIVANKSGATDNSGPDNDIRWNGHIGAMQGFFVKLDGTSGNILFRENMRVSGNNADENFFRAAAEEPARIRVNLTHADGLFKQTLVAWNESVSNDQINKGYDSRVFSANSPYAIYTLKAETPLAIQTVTSEIEAIPLAYHVEEAGSYTLAIDLKEAQDQLLYLKDNHTGAIVDASQGYQFNSTAGKFTERFQLTTNSSVLNVRDGLEQMYVAGKTLYLKSAATQTYEVINLLGESVMMIQANGNTTISLDHLSSGVYVISSPSERKKVILK
ncbi:MAG: BspA family leucine-rich repeat surface protein [Cyclobacteriaceae bacterium]